MPLWISFFLIAELSCLIGKKWRPDLLAHGAKAIEDFRMARPV